MADLRILIEDTKTRVARTVNAALIELYWRIGRRIREDILQAERAEYGKQIVSALSRELTLEYGKGYSESNLWHMLKMAEVFPDDQILYALRRELSWTHLRMLIYIDDPLKRSFYLELCRLERWSIRTLQGKIQGMLYERTGLSKRPEDLARAELQALRDEDLLTPDLVFRDPYLLDFLGLRDTFSEKDLESAILLELEAFLLELGAGFTFVARQKRITVDGEDYYLDLLLYHRDMRRLVAIDHKLGKFKAQDKGQMELYLRWLEKHEQRTGEDAPLGLILCADKSEEHIELLQMDKSGMRVARYMTELPPRDVLERKLHDAMRIAQARVEAAGASLRGER
jgi:predicted nuclease of restriction endonuclease-like (RecB) superfamily